MNDTLSEHMRVSVVVAMMASFLLVVVGVTVFSLKIFGQHTGKYADAMVNATSGTLYELSKEEFVACPVAYSAIMAAPDTIDSVMIKYAGTTDYKVLYDYTSTDESLIRLMTGANVNKTVRFYIEPSSRNKQMIVIKLDEVKR